MLFETSYYAEEGKQGQKAYALLLKALQKTKMAGKKLNHIKLQFKGFSFAPNRIAICLTTL